MSSIDFLLKLFLPHRRHSRLVHQPQNILISNIAFLGDVVISTTVLRALKKKFPDAKIGFLVASQSEIAAKSHPLVNWVHSFDHWYVKRSFRSLWRHWTSERKAVKELRSIGYDVAIELHPYFPNAISLLYQANIPVRIGYESGGLGPLLTHPFPFQNTDRYIGFSFLDLLKPLSIHSESENPLPYYPVKSSPLPIPGPYILIHMGTSSLLKEWPLPSWKELLTQLSNQGKTLVFTGKGNREKERVKLACSEVKNGIDLTDRLSWIEFVQVVQQAQLLISVDSASIHVAAATQVATLGLFCGISEMKMWLPPHLACKGMIHALPCAPCFQKRGCSSMRCIRELSPQTVFEAAREFL